MVSFINRKVWHLIMAVVLALSLILVSPVNQVSAADMAHQVTNVNNLKFSISWVTDATETGYVNYGTSADSLNNTAYDDRGQATEDDTHYVPISGLTASTPYYYEIVSGGATYNNSGVPYEITTGPGLDFKMPDPITGTAYKEGGVTAAEGTIIYVNIDTSQVLSVLVGSSGAWGMDIGAIRAADYQSYYAHSDSNDITIEAQGGADGTASQVVTIATAKAGAPAMTLAVALTANFSADVTAASVGETIQFTNATSGGTPDYSYEWDFNNDGTVDSTEASPTHAYTSTGTYTVSLTVTDSETSTDTETKTSYINVAEGLVAGFSADVTAANVDGTIQFTNATTGGAPDYSYEWDFNNDGTADSTEASPTHAYTSTGTYTVSLTVTDSQARTDTETKIDYINVAEELVAGFGADLTAADTGDTIQFTDATTGGAPDYSYEWDFNNDGTVDSTEASPSHVYTTAGTYTVSLTVTDSQARTDTETKTDYINIIAGLVAGFSADVTVANVDGTIQFTDATAGGVTPYSYEWDFNNDGTVDSTEASPSHAYTSIGTYTVSLTVTDSQTRTDTETKTSYINVAEGLVADFSADVTIVNVGDVIQFTSAAAGGTPDYSYEWDFDNDGTVDSTEANPSHTYTSAGTYSVSLTVTDSQARTYTETKTDYINAAEELVAGFSADVTAADVGGVIQFTDATSGGATPYTYEWDFNNDGTVDSTEADPTHTYTTAGTYTVSLVVTDSLARTDTETKTDYINAAAVDIPHQVTNVGNISLAVTWVTDIAETGYVNYGTSASSLDNTAYDDRGQLTEDDTHHVTITGMTADTPYCYEIVSGGVTYNNVGVPYEISTGPILDFKMPDPIIGTAYKVGGVTAAEGTIIYVSIGTSQTLSVLVDSNGACGLDIGAIRAADYQSYYTYSDDDNGSFRADGGADGMAAQTATIAIAKSGALTIELTPDPTVDFSADVTVADVGDVIQFTNTATDGVAPYTYEWDFNNDGTTDSTEANPSHAYSSAGTYSVSLTVTDSLARTDTKTKTNYINVNAVEEEPVTEETADVTPSEVVEEIPPDKTADELEEMDAEEAAGIIEEVTTDKAADIIEVVTTSKAAGIIEVVTTDKAADIIEVVTTSKAADIIEVVTTSKAADIIEVVTTSKAINIIEGITTAKAADIIEVVTTSKAVNIIEGITTAKAANIIEVVTTSKAANIIEVVTTSKAANIIEVVTTSKAANIIEMVTTAKAADIIEVITTDKATDVIEEIATDKAADIIEVVTTDKAANIIKAITTTKAADIIEVVTTDKAANIIEVVTITKAADIIEVVTTGKAADIIEGITTDKAADIIEMVTTDKAADIIEMVTTDKAADIIEETTATKAASIIEMVTTDKAVNIIEGVTTDKAADIIEVVTTNKAANIIEGVTTDKAVNIIEEVTASKAANIIEGVTTSKAVAVMEDLTTEKLTNTIPVMSEKSLAERLPGLSTDKLYSVEPGILFDSLPNAPTEQLVSEESPQPPAEAEAPIAVYTTPSGATYLTIKTWAGEWVVVMATPPPVNQLMIKTKRALENVETSLRIFEEQPPEVAIGLPADQIVRTYISITLENAAPEDIELGHMTFRVEKEWLEQNSIHKWSVTLNQYDPELAQWIALPTKRTGENDSYVYYTVAITHFSIFAVSGSQALPPLNFEVANLAINPVEAKTGEDIIISADIINLSNAAGTYAVILWIDGTVEAGKNVSLEAGETTPVSFTVIRDVVGTYQVRFDRLFNSFSVTEAPLTPSESPFNWWLIIGIIAGVIALAALIFVPLRKAKRAL